MAGRCAVVEDDIVKATDHNRQKETTKILQPRVKNIEKHPLRTHDSYNLEAKIWNTSP